MNDKQSQLDSMMQKVVACDLCCKPGNGMTQDELLRNLIAENPNKPHYGEIPTMYSDWANPRRLNAKLTFVLQDWGSAGSADEENGALVLRRCWKEKSKSMNSEDAWRDIIQHRPKPSDTHENIIEFFNDSAKRENLQLPNNFLDHIFFTNAILCFRQGGSSNPGIINLNKSINNCCKVRMFLRDQLSIVHPLVVVAGGVGVSRELGFNDGIGKTIKSVRENSPYGYKDILYHNMKLCVVPIFHPVASRNRTDEEQKEDYRFIWRALSHKLGLSGQALVDACFPDEA
jgi:uracil-DNA glycosylase